MSHGTEGWVPVIPGAGLLKETAQMLLAIAQDPALVRTDGNGTEFLVPSWVADSFAAPAKPPQKRAPRARKTESEE